MQRSFFKAVQSLIHRRWVQPLNGLVWKLTALKQNPSRDILIRFFIMVGLMGRLVMTSLKAKVIRLEGTDWTIVCVGEGFSVEELRHTFFPGPASIKPLGQVYLWQVPALVKQFTDAGEFVVCGLNHLVQWRPQARYVLLPESWVFQVIDLAQPLESIRAGMNKNMRRNIRKLEETNFCYRFTQNRSDFDLFYHQMYLPYISYRHGKRAIITKYNKLKSVLEQGGLIMVEHLGHPVSAMCCTVLGSTCHAGSIGVHKEKFGLAHRGAITAVFWFMLEWAWENGLHKFNMGGSRAMLADGVFNFKRQWGAHVETIIDSHIQWILVAQTIAPDLCRFLNSQGFIGKIHGKWRIAGFETSDVSLTETEIERAERISSQANLEGLLVLSDEKKWARGLT